MSFLFSFLFLCFVSAFSGQGEATYDSLNIRVVWTNHGAHEYKGLALAPDTTLWTCYAPYDSLIKFDASNPESTVRKAYAMDSTFSQVIGVVDDTMLIVCGETAAGDWAYYTININADPPVIVSVYVLTYALSGSDWYILDTILVQSDFIHDLFSLFEKLC